MKLKHFRESDFHEVCGMREEITTLQSAHPDEDEGHGFRKKASQDVYLQTAAMFLNQLAH